MKLREVAGFEQLSDDEISLNELRGELLTLANKQVRVSVLRISVIDLAVAYFSMQFCLHSLDQ